ncbi:hypothetical protein NPIL_623341 [Nephila pilipes]|uniref:Uncharacterized protein n=1 Tax=Nephila pilipes TaxID=299642 RepID=A0A8X6NMN2_NEPPI|nr:hypothetical protein NPIL_623341 [Nephila pilipes]
MIVQSESLHSKEKREVGYCCSVSVPTRKLIIVLLGAVGRVSMVTNCVVKRGRDITDACCESLNLEFVTKRMIVQSESLHSKEEREVGYCCSVSVPTRKLIIVLLGAVGRVSMVTNCVVKRGRDITDACCESLNLEFVTK